MSPSPPSRSPVAAGVARPVARRRRLALVAGPVAIALVTAACSSSPTTPSAARRKDPAAAGTSTHRKDPATTTTTSTTAGVPPTTATVASPPATAAPPTTAAPTVLEGPVTSPPLPRPGPGFVEGHVTAIGDSVMLDYQGPLEQDVPGITVTAAVSRNWTAGETVVRQLQAAGQLGAVVVIGLSTNGPVSATQFNSMMALLAGTSRVVFVNTRVDRTWQTGNNAVLAAGVAHNPRAVLADWYSLAVAHPSWLYTTQTHLPIDGTGAQALAALVAGKV